MLRDAIYYLKKSVTFFDLSAKYIAPAIFLITFGVQFVYSFVGQNEEMDLNMILSMLCINLLLNMISFVYLYAAVKDAKAEPYTSMDCISAVAKKFVKLFIMTVFKTFATLLGAIALIVPGVIFAIRYSFTECILMDGEKKLSESFQVSRNLTEGKKMDMFKIILFCHVIILFFLVLLLNGFAYGNVMVFNYVELFLFSIYTLMQNKLLAIMYVDVVYGQEKEEEHEQKIS